MDAQQKRIERFRSQLLKTPISPDDHREIVDFQDEDTLLHMNHIDSAKCGRWQENLSPYEVQLIEQKVTDWCCRKGYHPALFLAQAQYVSSRVD